MKKFIVFSFLFVFSSIFSFEKNVIDFIKKIISSTEQNKKQSIIFYLSAVDDNIAEKMSREYDDFFCDPIFNDYRDIIKNSLVKKVVIFVHGTTRFYPSSLVYSFFNTQKTLQDKFIKGPSAYEVVGSDGKIKREKLFTRDLGFQGMKFGMHEITGEESFLKKIINEQTYKSIFLPLRDVEPLSTKFFMFNWPGGAINAERWISSKILYQEIVKIKANYPNAKVYVFSHSHGGTVTLQTSEFAKEAGYANQLIDFLITIGTPFSLKTQNYSLLKNTFNKYYIDTIYVCYSRKDATQDPFMSFPAPSQQKFYPIRSSVYNVELAFVEKSGCLCSFNHYDLWFSNKLPNDQREIFIKTVLYFLSCQKSFFISVNEDNRGSLLIYDLNKRLFSLQENAVTFAYSYNDYFNNSFFSRFKNMFCGVARAGKSILNLLLFKIV